MFLRCEEYENRQSEIELDNKLINHFCFKINYHMLLFLKKLAKFIVLKIKIVSLIANKEEFISSLFAINETLLIFKILWKQI